MASLLWESAAAVAARYWDTGDSVMSTYAPARDVIEHVRTLRQLERFVERIALPGQRRLLARTDLPAPKRSHW